MRNSLYIFLCLIFAVSCGTQSPIQEKVISTLEASERKDLQHIKLNFYSDSIGNIYHRTIDVSTLEGNGYYSYVSYARVYEKTDRDTYSCKELKDFVDVGSFHHVEMKFQDDRTEYFEDDNYDYSLYSVADGGVLDAHPKYAQRSTK